MIKMIKSAMFMALALTLMAGQAQHPSPEDESPYPNELPSLKLHEKARWKPIRPYVSTRDDVKRILGEPVDVYVDELGSVPGYKYDPDWTIVILYNGNPPEVDGRVNSIILYPNKRISMEGVEFPSAFMKYPFGWSDGSRKVSGMIYDDEKFGLKYSIYATDSADGRFHAGDLQLIKYEASKEKLEKYKTQ